jgi:hypothetical protein
MQVALWTFLKLELAPHSIDFICLRTRVTSGVCPTVEGPPKIIYAVTTHNFSSKNKVPSTHYTPRHNILNAFMAVFFNMSNTENKLNIIEIVR